MTLPGTARMPQTPQEGSGATPTSPSRTPFTSVFKRDLAPSRASMDVASGKAPLGRALNSEHRFSSPMLNSGHKSMSTWGGRAEGGKEGKRELGMALSGAPPRLSQRDMAYRKPSVGSEFRDALARFRTNRCQSQPG